MCSLAAGVLLSRVLGLSRFVLSQRARGSYDYVFWRRACVCIHGVYGILYTAATRSETRSQNCSRFLVAKGP